MYHHLMTHPVHIVYYAMWGVYVMLFNYVNYKMWNEITYPFPNFNGGTVEVWEWISDIIPHFTGACDYLSMLGLKLIHISEWCPMWSNYQGMDE